MKRILILTRCIEHERALEKILRQLGHEIFISDKLIASFLQRTPQAEITDFFEIIILSDTLTNQETMSLLESMEMKRLRIFRKTEVVPSEEERQFWNERGIKDWLVATSLLETIRELLNNTHESSNDLVCFDTNEKEEKISLNSLSLNATQQKFLQLLFYKNGKIITRNEMCQLLWQRPANASSLSQLSGIVRVLRRRLLEKGISGSTIVTVWGQGYHLGDDFFEQVTVNEMDM